MLEPEDGATAILRNVSTCFLTDVVKLSVKREPSAEGKSNPLMLKLLLTGNMRCDRQTDRETDRQTVS
jgi:hypothetical protein